MGRSSLSSHSELWKRAFGSIIGSFTFDDLGNLTMKNWQFSSSQIHQIANKSQHLCVELTSLKGRSEAPVIHQIFSIDELRTALSEHCCSLSLTLHLLDLCFLLLRFSFTHALSLSHSSTFPPKKKKMLYFYSSSFFVYTQFLFFCW